MESALSFLQIEANYEFVMLLMVGITILEYLINYWTNMTHNQGEFKTPISFPSMDSIPSCSRWTYKPMEPESPQEFQTPVQRIRGMKYLKLEQRAMLMPGVKRRLDQDF